jgi:hypothetical protein
LIPYRAKYIAGLRGIGHDRDAAAAARAKEAFRYSGQREISAARANECPRVQIAPVAALSVVFQPPHAVIQAAHTDAPAQIEGFAKGLDSHENKMRTLSLRVKRKLILTERRSGQIWRVNAHQG